MGAEKQRSPAADRAAAASCSGNDSAADTSTTAQIFNIDGEHLQLRRRVYGAPRLAQPGWSDSWQEVAR
jgi:hypothetical protein